MVILLLLTTCRLLYIKKPFENASFEFENIRVESFSIDGWLIS